MQIIMTEQEKRTPVRKHAWKKGMNRLIMSDPRTLTILSALCFALLVSGCVGKVEPVVETAIELPGGFSRSGSAEPQAKWWLAFEDEGLNVLVEQSLRDNFSLKSSWARLTQADALYSRSRAGLLPSLSSEASASHSLDRTDGTSVKSDGLVLGLSASYELDLWGRMDSEIEAARLDMEASGADLDAAAMSLAAEVAKTWYMLIRQTASLELYDQQIQTSSKALELITLQFRTGQVPLADVLQQRQLIETRQGEKMLLLSEKGQTENSLSILLGQVPGPHSRQIPAQVVDLPELPATGIPAQLIRSRPDIRSSFLALQAADQRLAAAVADQYPSLSLSASLETINSSAYSLFTDFFSSVMAGVAAPLFDGGLREAEVRRTRGAAEQSLHDYGQAVLTAVGEVEDALLIEEQQQQYIKSLQGQLDLAGQTLEQVKERYLKGVENYQRVLSAQTSLQSLQQTMISARLELFLNRVQLCRALGTGWDYSNMQDDAISADNTTTAKLK